MENISEIRKEWFIQQVLLLENGGLTKKEIAEKLDIKPQYLNSIVNSDRGASEKFVQNFCKVFSLNHNELLNRIRTYDKPLQFTSKVSEPKYKEEIKHNGVPSIDGIPLIPIEAMAGFGNGDATVMSYDITSRYVVPEFSDVDFMIRVKGSSMYPKYNSGDVIACKKLPLDTFIQWNKVYVLDTTQGAMVKRLNKSDIQESWLLVSDNQAYPPFDIPMKEVRSLAIVVGVIRLE